MSDYKPTIHHDEGTMAGQYTSPPAGCILHGSRSGVAGRGVQAEYDGCRAYAASGIELGWTATVGHDAVSLHMPPSAWGWNARGASSRYLAVEFAQATVHDPITDGQVRAFVWWLRTIAVARWPALDVTSLPMHSELAAGMADGKSDVFPKGDRRGDDLRARIAAEWARQAGGGAAEEDELSAAERQELEELRALKTYTDALTGTILPSALGTLEAAVQGNRSPLANIVRGQVAAIREQAGITE